MTSLVCEAQALEAAGCWAVVLECVPPSVAAAVTSELSIPTIGIGAGPHCSGQVQSLTVFLCTHPALSALERPSILSISIEDCCKTWAKCCFGKNMVAVQAAFSCSQQHEVGAHWPE